MNVLYCFEYAPDSERGGASRLTNVLVQYLRKHFNYKFFCFYQKRELGYFSVFDGEICLNLEKNNVPLLRQFLLKNQIDIIVNQMAFSLEIFTFIKEATIGTTVSLISVYHSMPGWELIAIKEELKQHKITEGVKIAIKQLLKPLYLSWVNRITAIRNKYIYEHSDRFVLLSKSCILPFVRLNKLPHSSKLRVIANPVSFEYGRLQEKEKIVLVVSRFSEVEKRISLVLKTWKLVEEKGYQDWKLVIVGFGKDEGLYRKLREELGLRNVFFEGKQNPLPYYDRAALFLMTSAFEGFGLTLLEAMQKGVVPVVMNSFFSLQDLVEDNQNGRIVANRNIKAMAAVLCELMDNPSKRSILAGNAVEKSKLFSVSNIASQWNILFNEVHFS